MVLDTEDLTNTTLHQIHILVMTWVKNSTLSTLGSWISWTSWWGVAATHNSPQMRPQNTPISIMFCRTRLKCIPLACQGAGDKHTRQLHQHDVRDSSVP